MLNIPWTCSYIKFYSFETWPKIYIKSQHIRGTNLKYILAINWLDFQNMVNFLLKISQKTQYLCHVLALDLTKIWFSTGRNATHKLPIFQLTFSYCISTAEWKKNVSLGVRVKNDVSRREDEERHTSALLRPVHSQYTAKYVVLHPRAKIRSSFTQPSIHAQKTPFEAKGILLIWLSKLFPLAPRGKCIAGKLFI